MVDRKWEGNVNGSLEDIALSSVNSSSEGEMTWRSPTFDKTPQCCQRGHAAAASAADRRIRDER